MKNPKIVQGTVQGLYLTDCKTKYLVAATDSQQAAAIRIGYDYAEAIVIKPRATSTDLETGVELYSYDVTGPGYQTTVIVQVSSVKALDVQ